MKTIYHLLLIFAGWNIATKSFAQTDSLDNLSTDEQLDFYHTQLQEQKKEKSTTYHEYINQLSNSFQNKAIQTNHNKQKSLFYSGLLIGITGCIFLLVFIIYKSQNIYKKLQKNQEQTRLLLENTEDINTAKARFLKEVSYKIRTPLNTVMGFSEILAENPELIEPEDLHTISETLQSNSQELQQLVNAVLDLSRLESGMMKYELSDYNLGQICQDAVSIICLHNDNKRRIGFSNSIAPGYDWVNTDVTRLTQIISGMLQKPAGIISKDKAEESRIHLSICKENPKTAHIKIYHAPILDNTSKDSLGSIRLQIARLFIEHFGGHFCIDSGNITFTYPLK